jgi:hypothetical protein
MSGVNGASSTNLESELWEFLGLSFMINKKKRMPWIFGRIKARDLGP